ncbi:MAG: hypothetical protein ABR915_09480 [Thermoguttaceae bacterium]
MSLQRILPLLLSLAVVSLGCGTRAINSAPVEEEAAGAAGRKEKTQEGQAVSPEINDPEEWAKALARGQKAKHAAPLATFLQAWHKASHPVSEDMLRKKPEFEQAVYALFPPFFIRDALGKEAEYLIIQDTVDVHLVEGDLADDYRRERKDYTDHAERRAAISQFTIKDFRPAVLAGGKRVLYLDSFHVDVMARYLAAKHDHYLADSYRVEPNGQEDELDGEGPFTERLDYLNRSLNVVRGLWSKGWFFETHPYVQLVVLNKDLKTAVIYARQYNGGVLALMQRDEKGWRVVGTQDTWVE